jgi:hypothetical protein
MKLNALVMGILAVLAVGCTTEGDRHVFTDADIAAREEAKKNGQSSWVDTEQTVHALTCLQWVGTPPFEFCADWDLDAPAGTFDCTSDTTAYSGEILFFHQSGSTLNCAGINQSSSTQVAALGDYNDRVTSLKNNSSNSVNLYEHGSFGGAMLQTIWIGGNTMQNVTTSNNANQKVSSLRRN